MYMHHTPIATHVHPRHNALPGKGILGTRPTRRRQAHPWRPCIHPCITIAHCTRCHMIACCSSGGGWGVGVGVGGGGVVAGVGRARGGWGELRGGREGVRVGVAGVMERAQRATECKCEYDCEYEKHATRTAIVSPSPLAVAAAAAVRPTPAPLHLAAAAAALRPLRLAAAVGVGVAPLSRLPVGGVARPLRPWAWPWVPMGRNQCPRPQIYHCRRPQRAGGPRGWGRGAWRALRGKGRERGMCAKTI